MNYKRVAELVAKQIADGSQLHTLWFIDADGEPCWSQLAQTTPLMTGMTLQPAPGSPRYRVLSFEDFPENESITIVRVEVCQNGQRGPFDISPVSENDEKPEDWFPPRLPDDFAGRKPGKFPPGFPQP